MSTEKTYINSVMSAGNVKCKINDITIRTRPYKSKEGNDIFDVVLHLESEPIKAGNFKGLKMDYTDSNSKHYLGQVARVNMHKFGYSDGATKSGIEVIADEQIARALKSIFIEINAYDWLQEQDGIFKTKEALLNFARKEKIYQDKYLYYCLATRQYINKSGYVADDLYLPQYNKEIGSPFAKDLEKVIKFSAEVHVEKPRDAPKEVVKEVVKEETKQPAPKKQSPKEKSVEEEGPISDINELSSDMPWDLPS